MLEIFGPVPSRRLGQSLGINNIPPKHCTYSCVYCQLGKALYMTHGVKVFFLPNIWLPRYDSGCPNWRLAMGL